MDRRAPRRVDYRRAIDWVNERIVARPGRVMLAFLLVTGLFAVGLGNVQTEAGTEQFAEDIPAERALSSVNEEFGPHYAPDTGTTQLIQRGTNVLAKDELLHMLRAQERLEEREHLRVTSTSSAAGTVARQLDPNATTTEAQIRVVGSASPNEVDSAVREAADNAAFTGMLSEDFNRRSASASATVGVVTHTLPGGLSGAAAGQSGVSPLTPLQLEAKRVADAGGGDITVFGGGIIAQEFSRVIGDSLLIVVPAAVAFIVLFLVVAYRDLVDLLLGAVALAMTVVWTFGFLGLVDIPFNQIMIAVPPILLAVGIDFGIHAINRYREDRRELDEVGPAMRRATDQLLVAFFIVTGTTVIGFTSNLVSDLLPIRDFGLTAAVGIAFTFLIFGIFLPAAKVWVDRKRERYPIPTFSQSPLGSEGSALGRFLQSGVVIARQAPALFIVVTLLASAGAGAYATGVDTTFSQEDFLPPEETPAYLERLPEPFEPGEYSSVAQMNFLDRKFASAQDDSVTIYVRGRMSNDAALEQIWRAGDDPPDSFASEGRRADSTSIVTVVRSHAERDPEFERLVEENDRDGNGVPDDNLDRIYDYLLSSPARDRAVNYLSEDRRSARVVYTVEGDAENREVTDDAREVADRFRMDATATGNTVVFQAVSDLIFESAIQSLAIALGGTAAFLFLVYWYLEGMASVAVANLVPIVVAVSLVAGSMRLAGIAFNAFTATVLALTIGLGIDYSVHVVHRFIDERADHDLFTALERTVRGTGGALFGSMLTTTFGIGVLVLAILEVLGQFGLLTSLSVLYSFFASVVVLPSALVLWDRLVGNDPEVPLNDGRGGGDAGGTPAADGGDRFGADEREGWSP